MVLKNGSPLELDEICVLFMHACQFHVCLSPLHSMCLLHLHDVVHGCNDVVM